MEARGSNGQIQFDGTTVTITRQGLRAAMTVGAGTKRIPVGSLTAVRLRRASVFGQGALQLSLQGSVEQNISRARHNSFNAPRDENAVFFTRRQQPAFLAVCAALEQAITSRHTATRTPVVTSPAQELERLWSLVRQGALSVQEFEVAKRRLLGG